MRIYPFIATCLALSACGTPQVDVKKRWNQTLVNYSFVPLYPARSDVEVGDIRIHTITKAAEALDSRLIADWQDTGILAKLPLYADAVLPGLEAVRSVSLDTEATGLSGVIRNILGAKINASSSIYVSLQGLETAEVADSKVARGFVSYVQRNAIATPASENDFLWGLCASAQTFDDPRFKDIGISIVTRVIRAKEIVYYSGNALSNVERNATAAPLPAPAPATAPPTTPAAPATATTPPKAQALSFNSLTGSSLPKVQFKEKGVVVGVDALMIRPTEVVNKLAEKCETITPYFAKSQLRVLRGARGGNGSPN